MTIQVKQVLWNTCIDALKRLQKCINSNRGKLLDTTSKNEFLSILL